MYVHVTSKGIRWCLPCPRPCHPLLLSRVNAGTRVRCRQPTLYAAFMIDEWTVGHYNVCNLHAILRVLCELYTKRRAVYGRQEVCECFLRNMYMLCIWIVYYLRNQHCNYKSLSVACSLIGTGRHTTLAFMQRNQFHYTTCLYRLFNYLICVYNVHIQRTRRDVIVEQCVLRWVICLNF